jgi:hypothetical protein
MGLHGLEQGYIYLYLWYILPISPMLGRNATRLTLRRITLIAGTEYKL